MYVPERELLLPVQLFLSLLLIVVGVAGCDHPSPSQAATPSDRSKATGRNAMSKVSVRVIGPDGQLTGPVDVPKVVLTDAEWRKRLTPEQYRITRGSGTETAFCGGLLRNKESGVYACVCCDLPLFQSSTKFSPARAGPASSGRSRLKTFWKRRTIVMA